MYEPLADPSTAVRSAALTALTHLVLGGRLKAKGSVARVARLMVDADEGARFCSAFVLDSVFKTNPIV
jgi:hypothetical protein